MAKITSKPAGDSTNGHVLKIKLDDTKPAIWRRVAVPTGLTLADLHIVIQHAMGWENCHMHRFLVDGEVYYDLSEEPDPPEDAPDEEKAQLDELLHTPGQKLAYAYDFADDWEHTIVFEGPAPQPVEVPRVLKAVGACPPEDCGGFIGFEDLLDYLKRLAAGQPIDESEADMFGDFDDFDPQAFDLAAANQALAAWYREQTATFDAKLIPFPRPSEEKTPKD